MNNRFGFNGAVGVDFHVYDGKFQGSRSYLLELYRKILVLRPDLRFVFFLDKVNQLQAEAGYDKPNASFVRMRDSGSIQRLLIDLPKLAYREGVNILHTQYIVPPFWRRPSVVTIHDVLFETHPQFFKRSFVFRSKLLVRYSAKSASRVLSVSQFSANEISRLYGIDEDKISVTYNAADFRRYNNTQDQSLVRKYGLDHKEYLLTVGRIEPRKNHAELIRAYCLLTGSVPPLVIVGQRDFGYDEFESALRMVPSDRKVIILSDVSDGDLPAVYASALFMVYPSFAEGFGMPLLEAMACGTPVISSKSTAIPEVVGDGAILIDLGDQAGLVEAMQKLTNDRGLREFLVERGLERVRSFNWEVSAKVACHVFDQVLDGEGTCGKRL